MGRYMTDSTKSWIVAGAVHVCVTLHEGTAKTLGVMIPDISQYYNTDEWVVGIIIALMFFVGSFASFIIGPLNDRIPTRYILLTAGFLAPIGLLLASLSTISIATFGTVLILITGINLRIVFIVSIAKVGQYFDKYSATAYSLALMGSSTGVSIFAPFTQFLILQYGWRDALFLSSAILANLMVCGLLMSEPHFMQAPGKSNISKEQKYMKIQECTEIEDDTKLTRNLVDKLGLSLFCNSRYISLLVSGFAVYFQWAGWLIYVVPHAGHKGLILYQATSLATACGLGNVVGKVAIPILVDGKYVSPNMTVFLGLTLASSALLIDTVVTGEVQLIVLSACFGIGFGMCSVAIFVLSKTCCDDEDLTRAVGWMTAIFATARLAAGFLVGWIASFTGNYNMGWIAMGIVGFLGIVMPGVEVIRERCDANNQTP